MNSKAHLDAFRVSKSIFLDSSFLCHISYSQSVFHKVYLDGEGMKTHLEDFESQTWDGRSLKELNPHILDANMVR